MPDSPFVGFGFVVTSSTGWDIQVGAVVEKSQAASAGIMQGDTLLQIDGVDWILVSDLHFSPAGIIAQPAGTKKQLTFDRDGIPYTIEVVAEDLLPEPLSH